MRSSGDWLRTATPAVWPSASSAALTRAGHVTRTVESGDEGLRILTANGGRDVAAVVLDLAGAAAVDVDVAVVLDDGQTTLRAVMKGGLLPPPPTRDGPGVYVVRIGAQRTILEWTPAAAYSARKLARAKAKVA